MDHRKPHWSQGYSLRINIGLTISLALVLAAFEWKTPDESHLIDLPQLEAAPDSVIDMPITRIEPPKPVVKVFSPTVVEAPDDEVDDLAQEFTFDEVPKPGEVVFVPKKIDEPAPADEPVDTPFDFVESGAEPVGGYEAFYKYVKKELKYPSQARRMGVEGKVYVQFIIERDGSLTDVKVMKGIGAGCDEEAVRVLSQSPSWQPGKQRGRPVRQRMVMPLVFKLGQ
jgi:periplasmic protein TonB